MSSIPGTMRAPQQPSLTGPRHMRLTRSTSWAGRAACACAFALMSMYCATGGLIGGQTLGVPQ
jgi:hypothetical protein